MPIKETRLDIEALRPQAAPVDTYVRPAAPQKTGAMQLVEALSSLEPSLRQYAQSTTEKARKETDVRAQALAEQHRSVKSFQELVDKGLAQPGETELFKRLFKQQNGRVRALDASTALRDKYQSWEGRNAVDADGKGFSGFIEEFNQGVLKDIGEDPESLTGALPELESASRNLASIHAAEQAKLVYENYKKDAGAEVSLLLDGTVSEYQGQVQAWLDGGKQGEAPQFNADAVWVRANQLKNTSRAMRVLGNEVNDLMLEAVASSAMRRASLGDPTALEVLEVANRNWIDPKTGKSIPGPGTTGEGRIKFETAQRQVELELLQADGRADQRQKREGEKWLADVLPTLGREPLTAPQLRELGRLFGHDIQMQALSAVQSLRGNNDYDSPEALDEHYLPVTLGELSDPKVQIKEHFRALKNPNNKQRLADDYRSVYNIGGGSSAEGMRVMRNGPFSEYIGAIDAMASGRGDMIASLFPAPPEKQAQYAQRFRSLMLQYAVKNPESQDIRNGDAWTAATEYADKEIERLRKEIDKMYGKAKVDPNGPAGFPAAPTAGGAQPNSFDD